MQQTKQQRGEENQNECCEKCDENSGRDTPCRGYCLCHQEKGEWCELCMGFKMLKKCKCPAPQECEVVQTGTKSGVGIEKEHICIYTICPHKPTRKNESWR